MKIISFSFEHILIGLRLLIFGLFLKVVLADNLSNLVDQGFVISINLMSAIDVWT